MHLKKLNLGIVLTLMAAGLLFLQLGRAKSSAEAGDQDQAGQVTVSDPVIPAVVGPVRDLPPYEVKPAPVREVNPRLNQGGQGLQGYDFTGGPDPLLDLQAAAPAASDRGFDTPIFNFDGAGYQFLNPPDTNGAVGKDHYIQIINATVVSIYDKNTAALLSRFDLTALGGCSTGNGDPVVLYDQLADRWLLSEFGSGNSLCVFISQTPDPTGSYYSYQFSTPSFPDYPKYGVWPDGYYVSTNESSPAAYALDRANMLIGSPATSQRFTAAGLPGFGFEALTPSDWDGATPPPAGAPNYFMRHRDTEAHGPAGFPTEDFLQIWAFHVDWATPANSSFTQLPDISVSEFDSDLCGLLSFSAIAMPGVPKCSGSSLDPLREVIMFKLQYRNFGGYETLVGNFVTDVTGSDDAGVRWFELRKVGAGSWGLHQEGTYAPDGDSRWMGGIAMDGAGNIALGYNVSSGSTYPSLRYVGRLSSDPPGTMPQGEYNIVAGSAANGSNRYGDYSAMSVDPIDDCTFWFTGEYNPSSQWSTRIAAFRFDACGTNNFTISTSPAVQDICVPAAANYTVDTNVVSGFSGDVSLAAIGNPGSASFTPNPVTPPGSSTLAISGAAAGNYTFDVVGTSVMTPSLIHTNTVALNVYGGSPSAPTLVTPANGATGVPIRPTFTWNAVAQATGYLLEVDDDPGFGSLVYTATVAGTSHTPGVNLGPNTTYFWRVRANNPCGAGAYSAVRSFTTVAEFCSSTFVNIPGTGTSGPASPYPSDIVVSGIGTNLLDVNLRLEGLSHTYPDDMDMLLVGPQGQNLIFMSDAGGGSDIAGVDLTFDDSAGAGLPDSSQISTGAYRPTNFGGGDSFPSPAPAPSGATTLATFNGTDPNGTWSLFIVDDAGIDAGDMAGWCLIPVTPQPAIVLTKTVGLDPNSCASSDYLAVPGSTGVTYCYTVQNTGDVPFTTHDLVDDQLGPILSGYSYALAPGASFFVTQTANITQTTVNSATWTAGDAGGPLASSTDTATVEVHQIFMPYVASAPSTAAAPGGITVGLLLPVAAGLGFWPAWRTKNRRQL